MGLGDAMSREITGGSVRWDRGRREASRICQLVKRGTKGIHGQVGGPDAWKGFRVHPREVSSSGRPHQKPHSTHWLPR